MHAADDGQVVHNPGAARQVLRDMKTWHAGGNRSKWAAYLLRRPRLQIPRIQLAWTAVQEEENARLHLASWTALVIRSLGFRLQDAGEGQTRAAECADLQ